LKLEILNPTNGSVVSTVVQLRSSLGEALEVRPELSNPGDPEWADDLTRLYELRVSGRPPAAYSGRAGLAPGFQWEPSYSPSGRLEAVFTGAYTSTEAQLSARANYANALTGAAAKVEAVRTLLGVTWERTGHRLRVNEQDTLAEFTLTYRELIFAQSTG